MFYPHNPQPLTRIMQNAQKRVTNEPQRFTRRTTIHAACRANNGFGFRVHVHEREPAAHSCLGNLGCSVSQSAQEDSEMNNNEPAETIVQNSRAEEATI